VVTEKYETNLMLLNFHGNTKLYNSNTVLETRNKPFRKDIMQEGKLQALNSYIHTFTGHNNNMHDNILHTITPTDINSTGIVQWTCGMGISEPNS
jgi:hypothetical protein